jgi:hypothetical protein
LAKNTAIGSCFDSETGSSGKKWAIVWSIEKTTQEYGTESKLKELKQEIK